MVSVVMAVCNVERFLAESIESILDQTFGDFEFIIVDFGSTDKSKSIVSNYVARDERVKFHEISRCALPVARNAGCFCAQGKYIAIMDADDISLPNRLALEVDFMERHPQVALLGGATEWIDATGRSFKVHRHPTDSGELRSELVTRCVFWHPTVMMRREVFTTVGGYRNAFICSHDYDLELRIAEKYACANLEQIVLKYRIHPSQLTFHKQSQQTFCKLAAQASATSRRNREPDPLQAVSEITPALLTTLGIGEAAQQNNLVKDCHDWMRLMTAAQEYTACLNAANQMLGSNLSYVERWRIGALRLAIAGLYWKQKKYIRSFLALIRAVLTRPALVVRPFRVLWSRLQLRHDPGSDLVLS